MSIEISRNPAVSASIIPAKKSLDMGSSPTLGEAGFAGSVGWSNQGLELVIIGYWNSPDGK